MLVRATITVKSERNILVEVPDGEYTVKQLKEIADNDELLSVGKVLEENDEYTGLLGTNIYEIDGKAV